MNARPRRIFFNPLKSIPLLPLSLFLGDTVSPVWGVGTPSRIHGPLRHGNESGRGHCPKAQMNPEHLWKTTRNARPPSLPLLKNSVILQKCALPLPSFYSSNFPPDRFSPRPRKGRGGRRKLRHPRPGAFPVAQTMIGTKGNRAPIPATIACAVRQSPT